MKNRTILITGGTTGMGLATAQLLLADGAQVIVTGRNAETLAKAQKTLPGATVLRSDSSELADAQGLGNAVRARTDRLDAVFLNAGIAQFGPFDAATPQDFDQMFSINVRGVYFQLQSLLPLMSNPSAVVFNSSVASFLALPGASLYSAAKGAISALGRSLSVELAARGIRVNTISPGPIDTLTPGKLGMSAEAIQSFNASQAETTLAKRIGRPEEVAKLVRFLFSEDSAYIVGEEIVIDGGYQHT
ncbi:MAG TPA: SDR family oxidoreductase [Chthoniobacterales bacterium]